MCVGGEDNRQVRERWRGLVCEVEGPGEAMQGLVGVTGSTTQGCGEEGWQELEDSQREVCLLATLHHALWDVSRLLSVSFSPLNEL